MRPNPAKTGPEPQNQAQNPEIGPNQAQNPQIRPRTPEIGTKGSKYDGFCGRTYGLTDVLTFLTLTQVEPQNNSRRSRGDFD